MVIINLLQRIWPRELLPAKTEIRAPWVHKLRGVERRVFYSGPPRSHAPSSTAERQRRRTCSRRKKSTPSARQIDFCRAETDKYQRFSKSGPVRCRKWPAQGGNVTPPSSVEGLGKAFGAAIAYATPELELWAGSGSSARRRRDEENRPLFQLPAEAAAATPRSSATVAERSSATDPPRRRRREPPSSTRNCAKPPERTWPRSSCSAASRRIRGDPRNEDQCSQDRQSQAAHEVLDSLCADGGVACSPWPRSAQLGWSRVSSAASEIIERRDLAADGTHPRRPPDRRRAARSFSPCCSTTRTTRARNVEAGIRKPGARQRRPCWTRRRRACPTGPRRSPSSRSGSRLLADRAKRRSKSASARRLAYTAREILTRLTVQGSGARPRHRGRPAASAIWRRT